MRELTKLVKTAMGDRSIRAYAQAAEISPTHLSNIIREKTIPSPETLKHLASERADPQGGVDYEALMIAAGYQENNPSRLEFFLAESDKEMKRGFLDRNMSYCEGFTRKEMKEKAQLYKQVAKSIIVLSVMGKGLRFSSPDNGKTTVLGETWYDFALDIADQPISRWLFDFRYWPIELFQKQRNNIIFRQSLGFYIYNTLKRNEKVSVVVNNPKAYDYYSGLVGMIAYRGNLSVILVDTEKHKVLKEIYLSHYDEEDAKEILLV